MFSATKNSSLSILASCLLTDKKISIFGVPKLTDTFFFLKLLSSFGVDIEGLNNFKNTEKKHKELNLVICSPGGDLSAAFALIDVMRGSAIPVKTTGLGMIASAGLLIFISGSPGKRILTPNTSILSHQFTWGTYGKEHELFAAQKEFDLTTTRMLKHYKKCTGLTEKKIRKYLLPPQDIWLDAMEAKNLGICDQIKEIK